MATVSGQSQKDAQSVLLLRADFTEGVLRMDAFRKVTKIEGQPAVEKIALNDPVIRDLNHASATMFHAIRKQVVNALRDNFPNETVNVGVVATGVETAAQRSVNAKIGMALNQALQVHDNGTRSQIAFAARYQGAGKEALQKVANGKNANIGSRVDTNIEFKDTVGDQRIMDLKGEDLARLASTRLSGKGNIGVGQVQGA